MRIAYSTAVPLTTGSAPGSPSDTGETAVLGSSPNTATDGQNILVRVPSSTWTSMPKTGSYRATASS